jgi:thiamine biosynthesis lipoprotein
LLPFVVAAGSARGAGEPLAMLREHTMGTVAEIRVHGAADPAAAAAAAEAAMAELRAIDRLMAVQRGDSDVTRMNQIAARAAVPVDPRVREVLRVALRMHDLTGGAFDVTVLPVVQAWGFDGSQPHRPTGAVPRIAGSNSVRLDEVAGTVRFLDPATAVDLGGIAKGYALDRARAILRAAGVSSAYLDLGGQVATLGPAPDGGLWRIAIRHPRQPGALLGVVSLGEGSVSTSGDAERFVEDGEGRAGHVIDPRTGRPATRLVVATVVAVSATTADALSTAALVMGGDDFLPLASRLGVEALLGTLIRRSEVRTTQTAGLRFEPA